MEGKEMEQKLKDLQTKQEANEKNFQSQIDVAKKDFELKLESSKKDANEWKDIAAQKEEDLRQFQEKAEQDKKDQVKKFAESRKAEISEFIENSVKSGQIVPAQKDNVIKLMESMTSDAVVVEFSEKDGSKKSHTQLSLFKAFITSSKALIHYGEQFSSGDNVHAITPDENAGDQQFMDVRSEGTVKSYPVDDADIAAKAYEYQESQKKLGRTIEYGDAVIAVSPKKKVQV